MTLNRSQAPMFTVPDKINLIYPEKNFLTNGVPFSFIKAGSQPVVRVDLLFECGSVMEKTPLAARAAVKLLNEGTTKYSGSEIASKLDSLGAYLQTHITYHHALITFYCLTDKLKEVLPIVFSIVTEPLYPEDDVKLMLSRWKEEFTLENEKVAFLAGRRITQRVFGECHPYANKRTLSHYDELTTQQIREFYKEAFHPGNCTVIASGDVSDKVIAEINSVFGIQKFEGSPKTTVVPKPYSMVPEREDLLRKGAVQAALRMGILAIDRKHEDFVAFSMMNTILGGYFGSRLMKSVREEKGLTYGISSSILPYPDFTFWTLSCQTNKEKLQQTIDAVYAEIEMLRKKRIPDEELKMAVSYSTGEMLRHIDGPFGLADTYISLLEQKVELEVLNTALEKFNALTPDDINIMAVKYLDPSQFQIVTVS